MFLGHKGKCSVPESHRLVIIVRFLKRHFATGKC